MLYGITILIELIVIRNFKHGLLYFVGLGGFEVGIVQEGEEDSRWPATHKPESQEPKWVY